MLRTLALFVLCGTSALASNIAVSPNGGFWVQTRRQTLALNGAPEFANVPHAGEIVAVPGHNGYWVVTGEKTGLSPTSSLGSAGANETGTLYARGDAPLICGPNDGDSLNKCSGYDPTNASIVGAAAKADGRGLWALDSRGAVWTAGTAKSYGDVRNKGSKAEEIVGTPSGNGYYIFMADGGVYSFGDAVFFGSTGGKKPGGHEVTSAALSLDASGHVVGYWMVTDDGGVFSFGDALFLGSAGGNDRNVVGITALEYARGYAWANFDGGVGVSKTFPRVLIRSQRSGFVVDVLHGSMDTGALLVQSAFSPGSTSQEWDFFPTDGNQSIVQMVNVNSRQCADLSGANYHEIVQYPCKPKPVSGSGWNNQRWTISTESGSGGETNVLFRPLSDTGYLLGIKSLSDGSQLTLYPNRVLADGLVNWGTSLVNTVGSGSGLHP